MVLIYSLGFYMGFLPPVTCEQREEIMARRGLRDKKTGKYIHTDFRSWTDGILTLDQQRQAEKYDRKNFNWEKRRHKIIAKVFENDPDVICLEECDNYHTFFKEELQKRGYDSVWKKRPRDISPDGSCIAWRRSFFKLHAYDGVDFLDDPSSPNQSDRIALLVVLHWRNTSHFEAEPLVICTTHLARNPENRELTWIRARQMHQLFHAT